MGITHPKYKAAAVRAAPVWIDLEGTVAKTIRYIEEAAKSDVDDALCQLHLRTAIRTMYPSVSRRHSKVWRPPPRLAPAA